MTVEILTQHNKLLAADFSSGLSNLPNLNEVENICSRKKGPGAKFIGAGFAVENMLQTAFKSTKVSVCGEQ